MHFYLLLLHGKLTVKSIQPAKFGPFFTRSGTSGSLSSFICLNFVITKLANEIIHSSVQVNLRLDLYFSEKKIDCYCFSVVKYKSHDRGVIHCNWNNYSTDSLYSYFLQDSVHMRFFFYKMDIRQFSFKFNLGNVETGC